MLFGRKKKGMIDIKELVRQGKVRPEAKVSLNFNTNKDGFVDMGHPSNIVEKKIVEKTSVESEGGFMDFMNVGGSVNSVSDNGDGYSKREVDVHIQKLDSMIYKLEQRVELLERKAGVGNSSNNSSVGAMGW